MRAAGIELPQLALIGDRNIVDLWRTPVRKLYGDHPAKRVVSHANAYFSGFSGAAPHRQLSVRFSLLHQAPLPIVLEVRLV